MNGGGAIELGELVLPGASAAEGAQVAAVFQNELGRLWDIDRAAGISWTSELGTLTLDLDPALRGDALGRAIAQEVSARARRAGAERL